MTNNISYNPQVASTKLMQRKLVALANREPILRQTTQPSPHFNFSNSTISASGQQLFNLGIENNVSSAYIPMTNLVLNNQSGHNIYLCIGDQTQNKIYIPSGVIKTLSANDLGGGYSSFIIIDADGSGLTTSTIFIDCYKEGITTETAIQKGLLLIQRQTNASYNTIGGFTLA